MAQTSRSARTQDDTRRDYAKRPAKAGAHQRVVFLKPLVTPPKIVVGDYTYFDDPDDQAGFEHRNCGGRASIRAERQTPSTRDPSTSSRSHCSHRILGGVP